jgi:hypothetical protein
VDGNACRKSIEETRPSADRLLRSAGTSQDSAPDEPTYSARALVGSAILLHTLPMSAQRDYNAIDAEGYRETSAKHLISTSIQHQPNVRLMADAPDSKSGPCKRCELKSHLSHELRRAGRISIGRLAALERYARHRPAGHHLGGPLAVATLVERKLIRQAFAPFIHGSFRKA